MTAASASASAGDAAAGVVGSGGVPAGPVSASDLLPGALVLGGVWPEFGEALLGQHAEPDQRRGGVILAEIGAHAVDAAVVHEVGFLEAALAGDDVVGRHEHIAGAVGEGLRVRRRLLVGEHRRPSEQRETDHRSDQQHPFQDVADGIDRRFGQLLVLHVRLPCLDRPLIVGLSRGCLPWTSSHAVGQIRANDDGSRTILQYFRSVKRVPRLPF